MIFLFLFNINQIEDINSLYLMDKSIGFFPYNWVEEYISNRDGIQTSQGCLDIERWYQVYNGKVGMDIGKHANFYYHFYKLDDYNFHIETHRFDLDITPPPYIITLTISPNYLKVYDFFGLGFGLWKDEKRNLRVFLKVKDFDHNYAISRVHKDTIQDPYLIFPFQFKMVGNYFFQGGFINFNFNKGFPSKKKISFRDTLLGFEYRSDDEAELHFYSKFNKYVDFYLFSEYRGYSSASDIFSHPSAETLKSLFIQPAGNIIILHKEFYIGLPIYYKFYHSDSSLYRKWMYGFSLDYKFSIYDWAKMSVGYQKGWRERWIDGIYYSGGNGDRESRLIVGLDLLFLKKTRFRIIEGIELDGFPENTIRHPHNHTFVSLQYTP